MIIDCFRHMVDKHGQGADPLLFAFGHGRILVKRNLQHSQVQPYDKYTRVISPLLNSLVSFGPGRLRT